MLPQYREWPYELHLRENQFRYVNFIHVIIIWLRGLARVHLHNASLYIHESKNNNRKLSLTTMYKEKLLSLLQSVY